MGRSRVSLLAIGAVLLTLGCLLPVVVPEESVRPLVATELSVLDCARGKTVDLQVHDTYWIVGSFAWAARSVLAAAVALLLSAAMRRRGPVWFVGGALAVAVAWLFLEVGRPALAEPLAEASTAYPPLSAVEVRHPLELLANVWWTWAALAAGALLVAGAGSLRIRSTA